LPKLYGCQVGLPNCWSCSIYIFLRSEESSALHRTRLAYRRCGERACDRVGHRDPIARPIQEVVGSTLVGINYDEIFGIYSYIAIGTHVCVFPSRWGW
jgi:hypothetical protein